MGEAPAPTQAKLAEEFMTSFSKKKNELLAGIESLSNDAKDVNERLNGISNEIQKLSKTLHDAVLFLPSYSVKVRQSDIRDLEKLLKQKEDELIPKKKFGFKAKPPTPISPNNNTMKEDEGKSCTHVKSSEPKNEIAAEDSNFVTIEDLKDTVAVFDNEKVSKTDVLIRNLKNVIIKLHGSPSTLRIDNVKNCKILCGPVHTSVFVEAATDCVLFLCCQQLRTHNSKNTDIYLRVRSRAIIEECTGIRFAPYHWNHPLSKELHESANTDPELERFDAVDDFNWLSATQSPNWSILPPDERINFPSP